MTRKRRAFTTTSKRRKGFPSENSVKRGQRVVHVDKVLIEKLGRNDRCPCESGRSFQTLLPEVGMLSTAATATTIGATDMKLIQAKGLSRGVGSFSRLREKAGDEGGVRCIDPHPTLSRKREREPAPPS